MLKPVLINPERLVGVLRHGQKRGSIPAYFVSRSEAQNLLDCGFASWAGRWTLSLRKPSPLKLRDESCSIRPSTIMAALEGSKRHRAMIEAWA